MILLLTDCRSSFPRHPSRIRWAHPLCRNCWAAKAAPRRKTKAHRKTSVR
jgi:hypothetical protein